MTSASNKPPAAEPRPGFPPSPCIRTCTLNERDVCIGCHRTLVEIMNWTRMSAAEQWAVVEALAERRPDA